ncbi:DUF6095 family protein [Lacinutrix neustonica]|uniref:DUF6095 family protein n=1 Tax=Lacinutrix neustonica TaxID=2980107 RepID=A0A9E8MUY0_9FLAO|nr:DUF6095 family protein [Lacinutrix neustonica]WAC02023.1 DUF6095 family protein [Lacinutrix neustonica]
METKRTDKEVLTKGLKKMGISLILMFLGPTLIYIAFSNPRKIIIHPFVNFRHPGLCIGHILRF